MDHFDQTGDASALAFNVSAPTPFPQQLELPPRDFFTNDTRPEFRWVDNTGDVTEYQLQVIALLMGADINVGPYVIQELLPDTTTSFQAPSALSDRRYQWRVIARDFARNEAISETRTFTIDTVAPAPPAVLTSPVGLINDDTPLFQWAGSTSKDIFSYRLQIVKTGRDITAGPYVVNVLITGDPPTITFQATAVLDDDVYQWRVIAGDRATNTASSTTAVVSPNAPKDGLGDSP